MSCTGSRQFCCLDAAAAKRTQVRSQIGGALLTLAQDVVLVKGNLGCGNLARPHQVRLLVQVLLWDLRRGPHLCLHFLRKPTRFYFTQRRTVGPRKGFNEQPSLMDALHSRIAIGLNARRAWPLLWQGSLPCGALPPRLQTESQATRFPPPATRARC